MRFATACRWRLQMRRWPEVVFSTPDGFECDFCHSCDVLSCCIIVESSNRGSLAIRPRLNPKSDTSCKTGDDEMADHELDAASGGTGFEYGSIEWKYTRQKPDGTRR
jgi:hypothetical protein